LVSGASAKEEGVGLVRGIGRLISAIGGGTQGTIERSLRDRHSRDVARRGERGHANLEKNARADHLDPREKASGRLTDRA
jgi:hypothetical protein